MPDFERRKEFFSFTSDDARALRSLQEPLASLIDSYADDFYAHLLTFKELRHLLADGTTVERLKGSQQDYLRSLVDGAYDEAYFDKRRRIGVTHARVGMPPVWYLGGYRFLLERFIRAVQEASMAPRERQDAIDALLKIALIDASIAIDSYIEERDQRISSLNQFLSAFSHIPFGTLLLDAQLQVRHANQAAAEILHATVEQIEHRALGEVMGSGGSLPDLFQRAQTQGSAREVVELHTPTGEATPIPVTVTITSVRLMDARDPVRWLLVLEDERRMRELESDLQQAHRTARMGTWELDLRTGRLGCSAEARHLIGCADDQPLSLETLAHHVLPQDRETLAHAWKAALAEKTIDLQHRFQRDEEIVWLDLQGRIETDGTGRAVRASGTVQDISEQKKASERIQQLAFYDTLTGLPNRLLAIDRLEQALKKQARQKQPLAVLLLDIDRFKEINDSRGYKAGDQILVDVARGVGQLLRQGETLARIGGDEFLVILDNTDDEQASIAAARICDRFCGRIGHAPEQRSGTSLSIGVATFPACGGTAVDLLKNAEIAMFDAKSNGGATYSRYNLDMTVAIERRFLIAKRLQQALVNNRLRVFYQPKVNLRTLRLSGAEALLRWHDAELGWVSPAEFIPIAEARGLIGDIGDWVLQETASQIAAWRLGGIHLHQRIAVNVSAYQLARPGFVDKAIRIVRERGASPADIELEITETAVIRDPQKVQRIAGELVDAGFILSIDDFGTGYSSLTYLRYFPVRKLKIDSSFVREINTKNDDLVIVNALIGMSSALKLVSIAEGVETREQVDTLRGSGCVEAQGYYFGKPMPADEFMARWLAPQEVAAHAD